MPVCLRTDYASTRALATPHRHEHQGNFPIAVFAEQDDVDFVRAQFVRDDTASREALRLVGLVDRLFAIRRSS
jgi:hypothetical protein